MKKLSPQSSRRWFTGAAAGLAALTGGESLPAAPWPCLPGLPVEHPVELGYFRSGYEGVLGTSLDIVIEAARPTDAAACELHLLGEIERLRRMLSTYDPASEIRHVMAGAPVSSPELAELLALYRDWSMRTDGLIAVNLGEVNTLWRAAQRSGVFPSRAELEPAAENLLALNIDALGKAFIIDRAVAVARRFAPGGLLNIGGDIRVWGDSHWPIAVADPENPAENSPPLATVALREAAVATSGGYARHFSVGTTRFSHLIDPRTLSPIPTGGSATVIAADAVSANALSTAASIGGAELGSRFARERGAMGYLFVEAGGAVSRGGALAAASTPPAAESGSSSTENAPPPAAAAWPEGFQVTIPVVLKKHTGPREIYRPYVVVWIEDAAGNLVRTLTVWGTDSRWQGKLSAWRYHVRGRGTSGPPGTTRATRPPGAYTVSWDGKDDFGRRVPAGLYKVSLEICREDGHHVVEELNLQCGAEPVSGAWRETAESEAATVTYGPPPPP